MIAENGNASVKGTRKRGKGEPFCERSKKEQSARKISRCARNDSVGNGYPQYRIKCALGNAFFPYRHPERSRGIFFVGGKRASVWQRETGNAVSRKDGRRCFL